MQDLKVLALQSDLVWENPYANRIAFEEKIRKEYEKNVADGDEITFGLQDGIYDEPSRGGTAERNKTLYDIATILHYHEAVLYTDRPSKINDYDVLVKRNDGSTRFVFANNGLYNTNDEGYFSIMFYEFFS